MLAKLSMASTPFRTVDNLNVLEYRMVKKISYHYYKRKIYSFLTFYFYLFIPMLQHSSAGEYEKKKKLFVNNA